MISRSLLLSLLPVLALAFDVEVELDLQVEVRPPDVGPTFHLRPGESHSLSLPGPYLEAGEAWQVTLVKPPAQGVISPFSADQAPRAEPYDAEIELTYTPTPGFLGVDQFSYRFSSSRFDVVIIVPLFVVEDTSPSALFAPDLTLRRGAFIRGFGCSHYTPEGHSLFFAAPECAMPGLVDLVDPASPWNVTLDINTDVVAHDIVSPVTFPVSVDGFDPDGVYGATAHFNVTVATNQCPSAASLECISPPPAPWSDSRQMELISTLQRKAFASIPSILVSLRVGESSDPDGDDLRYLVAPSMGRSAPHIGQSGLNQIFVMAAPHEGELWVSVDDSGLAARTSMQFKVISYAEAVERVESIVRADRSLGSRKLRLVQLLKLVKRVATDPVFSSGSLHPRVRQQKAATEKSLRYLLKITETWLAKQPLVQASRDTYARCLSALTEAISR